jgi:6-phosphogluconolactonase
MASAALLSRIPVPPQNVHRIRGELTAAEAEREYSVQLRGLLHGGSARIDLLLLGVGEDGHTASLFPGSDVLDETEAMVRAMYVPRLHAWRITLTRPVLNNARDVLFLATGEGKAAIVQRVLTAHDMDRALPATMVRPADGNVRWMIDRSAAALLGKEFLLPPAGRTVEDGRERT